MPQGAEETLPARQNRKIAAQDRKKLCQKIRLYGNLWWMKFNQGNSRRSWNETCHGVIPLSDELEIKFGAWCLSSAKRFVFMVTCNEGVDAITTLGIIKLLLPYVFWGSKRAIAKDWQNRQTCKGILCVSTLSPHMDHTCVKYHFQISYFKLSGRIDMLTNPVAAARAAVATGAWVKSKHDMYVSDT